MIKQVRTRHKDAPRSREDRRDAPSEQRRERRAWLATGERTRHITEGRHVFHREKERRERTPAVEAERRRRERVRVPSRQEEREVMRNIRRRESQGG